MKLIKLFQETIILRPFIIRQDLTLMTTSRVEYVGMTPNKFFYEYNITPPLTNEEYEAVCKKFPKANMRWKDKMFYPVIE